MNIFVIHSYNGDTKDSFAPSVQRFAEKTGASYYFPEFPIRQQASYDSWSKVMEKYESDIQEDTIVIAHSLGTLFFPKWVAKNQKRIKGFISVAGYVDYEGREDLEEIMTSFYPSKEEFDSCIRLMKYRYSIYSNHDRMNKKEKLVRYAELLEATQIMVEGAGHFDPESGVQEIQPLNDLLFQLATSDE